MAIAEGLWTRGSTTTQFPSIATRTSPRTPRARGPSGPRPAGASSRVPTHAARSPSRSRHRPATRAATSGSEPGT